MSELLKRTLTGLIYVALVIGAGWAGLEVVAALFLVACAFIAHELARLSHPGGTAGPVVAPVLIALATYSSMVLMGAEASGAVLLVPVITFIALIAWRLFVQRAMGLNDLGIMALATLYVGAPLSFLPALRLEGPGNYHGFFLLLWTNDTASYLVGRAIGKHKLAPAISPGKTVEGFSGGLLLTLAMSLLAAHFWPDLARSQWLISAVIIVVAGTIGDLLESALKRSAGVKDSGHLLPGHGGFLDRFDSVLFAAPALYLYQTLFC